MFYPKNFFNSQNLQIKREHPYKRQRTQCCFSLPISTIKNRLSHFTEQAS